GSLSLSSVAQVDTATSTLTSGTWNVFTNSTLTLNGGAPLAPNNGNILLDGPNSLFTNNNLGTNVGSFTVQNGRDFTISTTLFTNEGVVTIGAGSQLLLAGGEYLQNAGTTVVNGTLGVGPVQVDGGVLMGSGTVD